MDVPTPFKDSVVETFLNRKLPFAQYETLRYYSAGAVCSDQRGRELRFVIVLADGVYSTENVNPTRVRLEAYFDQFLNIDRIHDFADFLSGSFRNDAQHVAIRLRDANTAIDSESSRAKSGAENVTPTPTDPSGPGPGPVPITHANTNEKSGTGARGHQRARTSPIGGKQSKPDEEATETERDTESLLAKADAGRTRGHGRRSTIGKLFHWSKSKNTESVREESEVNGRGGEGDVNVDIAQDPASLSLPSQFPTSDVDDVANQALSQSLSLSQSQSLAMNASSRSAESSMRRQEQEARITVLDLYELTPRADFLHVLRSSLFNYALEHAYAFDEEDETSGSVQMPFGISSCGNGNGNGKEKFTAEKVKVLSTQLYEDIADAADIRESFDLINELKVACTRYFSVRRQFWRMPGLFAHLVDCLQKSVDCLPQQHTSEHYADNIEYAVLILETIAVCLRGTDAYLSRMQALLRNNASSLRQLVALAVHVPLRAVRNGSDDQQLTSSSTSSNSLLKSVSINSLRNSGSSMKSQTVGARSSSSSSSSRTSKDSESLQSTSDTPTSFADGFDAGDRLSGLSEQTIDELIRSLKTAKSTNRDDNAERDVDESFVWDHGTFRQRSVWKQIDVEICKLEADYIAASSSVLHQLMLGCRFMQGLNESSYTQSWLVQSIERKQLATFCQILLLHLIQLYLIPVKNSGNGNAPSQLSRSLSLHNSQNDMVKHYSPLSHAERARLCEELALLKTLLRLAPGRDQIDLVKLLRPISDVELKYFASPYFFSSRLSLIHDDSATAFNDVDRYLAQIITSDLENLKATIFN